MWGHFILSKRNSSYLCVLANQSDRQLYDILDSRSKEHLSNYFSGFSREERLKVKFVTIDMWQAYKDVVNTYLPNAIIAVDPFHVVKHLNDGFSKLRLDLMNQCEYGSSAYYLLKKWHWMLMTDNVVLDNERVYNSKFKTKLNRRDLRQMIFDTFPALEQAYMLKEEYRSLNKSATYEDACQTLPVLTQKFSNSGIKQYDEFTSMLWKWQEEILNSFRRPYGDRKLSNAYTENINGKIQTYLTISNGVGNFPRFRKRVIYALSSNVYYALTPTLSSDKREGKKRGTYNKIHK